jgi:diaminopimelate epimerase
MPLTFTKLHGCGNDYLFVDCTRGSKLPGSPEIPAITRYLANRHTGVGSDGVILICNDRLVDFRMEMYNADGSRSEMCGNGIRCVGKYVYDRGLAKNPMRIDTDAGVKTLTFELDAAGRVATATVDMGVPMFDGPRIPVASEGRVVDQPLEVGGMHWQITCVSMGNPHCVVFVPDVDALDLEKIGPQFEHHPFFPNRVNTEFVAVRSRSALDFRVWERGSGETQACGTGACAALVAAVLTGHTDRRATISLRGGDLAIEWRADDHVMMTGAAAEVFTADVDLDQLFAATDTHV